MMKEGLHQIQKELEGYESAPLEEELSDEIGSGVVGGLEDHFDKLMSLVLSYLALEVTKGGALVVHNEEGLVASDGLEKRGVKLEDGEYFGFCLLREFFRFLVFLASMLAAMIA